ncbi:MAG: hypothetical protein WC341_02230, partial [Bacteroidales bacterium]
MTKLLFGILIFLLPGLCIHQVQAESNAISGPGFRVELPDIIVANITQDIRIDFNEQFLPANTDSATVIINGKAARYAIMANEIKVPYPFSKKEELTISIQNT